MVIADGRDWRTLITQYIKGTLSEKYETEKRRITFRAKNYCLMDDQLFRRALTNPLLQCVGEEEARVTMSKVHSGISGDHMAGKNLALKVLRLLELQH